MPLDFKKAIEIIETPAAAVRDPHTLVMNYLQKKDPTLAALVERDGYEPKVTKDMTVGDVHATTALGNNSKPKSFKERLAELQGQKPDHVVEVDKRDGGFSVPITILKAEPDQQLIFGWASVSEVNGKLVVDKQDDVILIEDLEKAAYDFVLYARQQGDMHQRLGTGRMVESMVFTKQKQEIMGIDLGMQGWWCGFKVDDQKLWEAHKRGERPEFSIGGKGERVAM